MVALTNALAFLPRLIILAALLATGADAAPWPTYATHGTHRVRTVGKRGVTVSTYHPKNTFKTYAPADAPSVASSGSSLVETTLTLSGMATSFMNASLGVAGENMLYRSGYAHGATRVAFVRQSVNGIPVANGVANIAFSGNTVLSYGSSFVDLKSATIAPAAPTLPWTSVLPLLEATLDATYLNNSAVAPALEYLIQPDGALALVHVLQARNGATGAWYEAYVDAHGGAVVGVVDYVAEAAYTVVPVTKQSFADGVETLVDPADVRASPLGWHNAGFGNSTTTSGNNVLSFKNQSPAPQSAPGLQFTAAYDDRLAPTDPTNLDAALTNAFYVLNVMHDVAYRYGFTEANFNFQLSNFGRGGTGAEEGDRVLVQVQDPEGVNNANFATPPDGQSGVCRMFIWDLTDPNRDGAMQNDILIHEMTHGITNRLTGGGTARCLQTLEAGGLGEGWGDAMASWMRQDSAQTQDFAMAGYVSDTPGGIRAFPYSTDPKVNPLTYASLRSATEVHGIGEVWANILHNVYAALVSARGFAEDKLTNPDGSAGNTVFMRLFMDALPLQPCNPTFVEARDAWFAADTNRFNGANRCTLQKAFASRGLGLRADDTFQDDATIDADC